MTKRKVLTALALLVGVSMLGQVARAQQASLSIIIKNHRFQPSQLSAPANVPVTLR